MNRSISAFAIRSMIMATLCFMLSALAQAQTPAPKPSVPVGSAAQPSRAPHQPPCWQQVGISKAAIEQRKEIERNTRTQVEEVCADASLTTQQKHAKIKELHQRARQQIESIITPQQQEELKACNAERNAGHPSAPPRPGAGPGPCGEPAAAPAAPGTSGNNPPNAANPAGGSPDPKQQ